MLYKSVPTILFSNFSVFDFVDLGEEASRLLHKYAKTQRTLLYSIAKRAGPVEKLLEAAGFKSIDEYDEDVFYSRLDRVCESLKLRIRFYRVYMTFDQDDENGEVIPPYKMDPEYFAERYKKQATFEEQPYYKIDLNYYEEYGNEPLDSINSVPIVYNGYRYDVIMILC